MGESLLTELLFTKIKRKVRIINTSVRYMCDLVTTSLKPHQLALYVCVCVCVSVSVFVCACVPVSGICTGSYYAGFWGIFDPSFSVQ